MAVIIKTFSTPGGKYVYDRQTNSILSVNDDEHIALQRVEAGEADESDWQLLKRYRDQGYLQESRLKEIEHPATQYIPFHLENRMTQLTLQITQNCNLRCAYCTYGGGYESQRTHSNKVMPLETIYKCVDFIMARSRGVDEIYIGFYGGESFLEFDKIRACVVYVKEKYKGRPVRYTVTTNGTIFDDEIIRFLQEHNFSTIISIDGPRELHDINRVYANGSGTFDNIISNVERIKLLYPSYYSRVSFLTVVAPGADFSCINNYFSADDVLATNYNLVNFYGAKDVVQYDDLYNVTYVYQMTKVLLASVGLYSMKKRSKLFVPNLSPLITFYERLSHGGIPEKAHPSGPCVPGAMRPFVDVDGNIFPCERVNEGSDATIIGHIDTGFDMDKVNDILNVGKLTESECAACWNFMHCGLCVAACDNGEHLCRHERLKYCNGAMAGTLSDLLTTCLLLESKHDFHNIASIRDEWSDYHAK